MTKITNDLEEKTNGTCIVIFSAEWCGPCKPVKAILEDVSPVHVYEVDNEILAAREGVQGLPTVRYYKGGFIIDEFTGAKNRDKIVSDIQGIYGG